MNELEAQERTSKNAARRKRKKMRQREVLKKLKEKRSKDKGANDEANKDKSLDEQNTGIVEGMHPRETQRSD